MIIFFSTTVKKTCQRHNKFMQELWKTMYKLWPICVITFILLLAVNSFDSCYKLLTALTADTSCCWLWHLLSAVNSLEIFSQLLTAFTQMKYASFTSCHKLWQLWQASTILSWVDIFTRQGHISQVSTSSVVEWVRDKARQLQCNDETLVDKSQAE